MTNTSVPDRVGIITSVQRRRRWTAAEKMRLVDETFAPGTRVSLVARQNGVNPNQLFASRPLWGHPAQAGHPRCPHRDRG